MNCSEVEKFLHQVVDSEVGPEEMRPFEEHVAECDPCRIKWVKVAEFKVKVKRVAENAPEHSETMQENLIDTLKLESKREQKKKRVFLTSLAAAVVAIGIVAAIAIMPTNQPTKVASQIKLDSIVGHYHGHATMDKKKLMASKSRMAKKVMVDLDELSQKVGFSVKEKELEDFMLASSEVIKRDEDGRQIVRLCYKTSDLRSSTCIDCYQTAKGSFKIAGLSTTSYDGKEIATGTIDGNSVVLFRGEQSDTMFVSSLPKDRLIEMVISNPENLS